MKARPLTRVLSAILIVLMLGLLSGQIISVRLADLDYLLSDASRDESLSQSAALVGRYEIAIRRAQEGESEEESFRLEAQLAALNSGDQFVPEAQHAVFGMEQQPARYAVDGLRLLLGKELIRPAQEAGVLAEIEHAYAWQRFRRYDQAIRLYSEVLESPDLNRDLTATVLLHQAFSMSLTSLQQEALEQYNRIIVEFPETASAETARRLELLLQELLRSNTVATDIPELAQAVDAFFRLNYDRSISQLEEYLDERHSLEDESQARYYLGRSYEESGQSDDATEQYERVIWIDPESEWAQNAARRLTLMRDFYGTDMVLSDYTLRQLEQQVGPEFDEVLALYSSLLQEATVEVARSREVQGEQQAELWVRSLPAAAEVWVNDRMLGQTPLVVAGLGTGAVELEIRRGQVSETREIDIPAAGRVTLFVELPDDPRPAPVLANAPSMPLAVAVESPDVGAEDVSREAEQPGPFQPEPESEPEQPEPLPPDPEPVTDPSPAPDPAPEPEEPVEVAVVTEEPEPTGPTAEELRAREVTRIQEGIVSLQYMLLESERISADDVRSAHAFADTVDGAEFPVLYATATLLAEQYEIRKAHEERLDQRIEALLAVQAEKESDYLNLIDTTRAQKGLSTAGFVVGTVGAAGATAALWFTEQTTLAMESATSAQELQSLQERSDMLGLATAVSAGVGGVGLLTGIVTRFFIEDEQPLRTEILSVREQVEALKAQYGFPDYLDIEPVALPAASTDD